MARDFNDSNQYLSRTSAVVTAYPVTMACWFRRDSHATVDTLMQLVNYGGGSNGSFHWLYLDTAPDLIYAAYGNGGATQYSWNFGTINTNTWHHACSVGASSTSRYAYLDGSPGTHSTTAVTPINLSRTAIGAFHRSDATQHYHNGRIAEAAIWNVALTDAEVAILAKGYSPLLVRPGNLVAYWPLMGRYDPEIDIVGGYNLTLTNSPTTSPHSRVLYAANPTKLNLPIPVTTSFQPRHGVAVFNDGFAII